MLSISKSISSTSANGAEVSEHGYPSWGSFASSSLESLPLPVPFPFSRAMISAASAAYLHLSLKFAPQKYIKGGNGKQSSVKNPGIELAPR